MVASPRNHNDIPISHSVPMSCATIRRGVYGDTQPSEFGAKLTACRVNTDGFARGVVRPPRTTESWDASGRRSAGPRGAKRRRQATRRRAAFRTNRTCTTKARQHIDQTVCAEQIDPSTPQVADARLCDAENVGGLYLLVRADLLIQLQKALASRGLTQQMLRFVGGESQIPKHVAR